MSAITFININDPSLLSSSPTNNRLQFEIISLPDPACNHDDDNIMALSSSSSSSSSLRDYMLVSPMMMTTTTTTTTARLDIHEIQTVVPNSTGKYASYFVGSHIVSNPLWHISTRVDPLFFALAYFHHRSNHLHHHHNHNTNSNNKSNKNNIQWQPLDQMLEGIPSILLLALNINPKLNTIRKVHELGQLLHILDVSDMMMMCGDEEEEDDTTNDNMILCKFSEERTMQWLLAKFHAIVNTLRLKKKSNVQMEEARTLGKNNDCTYYEEEEGGGGGGRGGGSGAYSSSFVVAEDDEKRNEESIVTSRSDKDNVAVGLLASVSTKNNDNDNEEDGEGGERFLKIIGLQLLCEYIPTEYRKKLCKQIGLNDEDWMMESGTAKTKQQQLHEYTVGEKRSREVWEGTIGQEDADALLQYTHGCSGGGGTTSSGKSKTPSSSAKVTPGYQGGSSSTSRVDIQEAKSVGLKKLAKVNTKGMKSLSSFFGSATNNGKNTKKKST